MDLLKNFTDFIQKENLFQLQDKLVLAVSGGVDSVVLCELCKQANYNFVIVHCNFQLRGEESERDEQFVKDLAKKYDVEIFIKKFDTEKYAEEKKLSIQVAARELRYSWFEKIITQLQTTNHQLQTKLLTAHHANDNVETLLMNFFKGTGIKGLQGIQMKQKHVVRSLLFATKEQITNFATENNLPFVEDSSNASNKYTRNYFRNQLIPALQNVFPKVEENLAENLKRFKEIAILYQQSIDLHKKKLLEHKGEEVHIPVLKLLKSEPLATIVYEIIKDFNFTSHQTHDVVHLLKSESGKYIQSSTHKIFKNRNWLIISSNITSVAENILIEEGDETIIYPGGTLEIKKLQTTNYKLQTENNIAAVNADDLSYPLLLRKWKQGDYFYPLGMQKKKKLSKFFIDQKMSIPEKENTWIIECNKKIVWIVGRRIDDRFKIMPNTKSILIISKK